MKWTRHLKVSWVIGLIVITASLLGANHVLHAPIGPKAPEGNKAHEPRERPDRPADRGGANRSSHITTTGVVVPENDIVPLIPSVKGEVVEVFVKNDDTVKKGQPLLKMNDSHARNLLKQAEVGVKDAENQLEQAKNGIKIYELKRDGQQLAIEGWKKKLAGQKDKIAKLQKVVEQKLSQQAEIDLASARYEADAIELTIKSEETKLAAIEAEKPNNLIARAQNGLDGAKLKRDEAQLGVDACTLKAPGDGVIMQSLVSPGSKFGEQAVKPAFLFYSGKLIVKAEVNQEWANRVAVGQTAEITDYSNNGQKWTGKVKTVGRGFLPKREATAITDLIPQNQEMVLECRIELDPGQKTPFLNQKVRVRLSGE